PIPNTNIIATPLAEDANITFAISSLQGEYKLKLQHNMSYQIAITHLGFKKITDTIKLTQDRVKNYTLYESTETLEEILIKAEMAVIVKEDTITYRTDQFKTGEERKLRDVLKKLPGIEVDRAGNVTVNGKPVTKLMVDGKEFFTGDEKLGVNNIPADAVDEVEALDNYSEVAFLKGLEDSDRMALNIKLKEGKKKFAFGDVEVGGGHEDRYIIHPTLFYYSPKTAVNVIGDFNNIGKKSFSVQDYVNFEGGFAQAINDPSGFFNLYRDDFAQFLSETDFVFSKNDFGAGSISQEVFKNTTFDAYSIVNKGKMRTRTSILNEYLATDTADEQRELTSEETTIFSINKLKLSYDNFDDTDIKYNALLKTSDADGVNQTNSTTENTNQFINTTQSPNSTSFIQEVSANKQFSYKHTTSLNTKYQIKRQSNTVDWLFNQPVFSGIITFIDEGEEFNLLQNTRERSNLLRLNLKHYWVLDNFNHIYPIAGLNYFNSDYDNTDAQILNDGSLNSFESAGFNNAIDYRLLDAYGGFQYKFKIGDFIGKPGLVVHNYNWKVDQMNTSIADNQKTVLLPEVDLEYKANSSKKLSLKYNLISNFGNAQQYANRLRLLSFNSLSRGSEDLENQLYHRLRLRYFNFNMFKGVTLSTGFSYTKRERSIRSRTEIEGIDQVNTLFYTDLPENSYNLNFMYSKRLGKWHLSLSTSASLRDYIRIINEAETDFDSQNLNYDLKAETRFKDWPNFEFGFSQTFNTLNSDNFDNEFMQIQPYVFVEYDFLKDFLFKFDYRYNYFENRAQNTFNRFEIGSTSLEYWKEGSAWSFQLGIDNLFDVQFKQENSVSNFLASDRSIFIQPRTVVFSVIYKL
ncbi:TonB-dependent receptor, partial [Mesohalobacter salilacus]|uniref:TonB-dependent receptor n=1 Tax=Mesohalobacter salilacus TaxID=2491711 RepID=UPI00403EC71E